MHLTNICYLWVKNVEEIQCLSTLCQFLRFIDMSNGSGTRVGKPVRSFPLLAISHTLGPMDICRLHAYVLGRRSSDELLEDYGRPRCSMPDI
jgi:hypothetical protein